MIVPDELNAILDRITNHQKTESDMVILRQWFGSSTQIVSQGGKYAVNLGQEQDIQISDRIYQGASAKAIQRVFQEVLDLIAYVLGLKDENFLVRVFAQQVLQVLQRKIEREEAQERLEERSW